MAKLAEMSPAARRGLVAVVMLALLLAAAGAAKLLQDASNGRARAGERIMQQVRQQRLAAFWPQGERVTWYLVEVGGAVVGWRADLTLGRPGGEFAGLTLEAARVNGPLHIQELWWLNSDATAGRYNAAVRTGQMKSDTSIVLNAGKVEFRQAQWRETDRADAPANYLPEGTLELALRLVAKARTQAQFAMVLNDRHNPGGIIEFANIRAEYVGEVAAPGGKGRAARVKVLGARMGETYENTYDLDAAGNILQIRSDSVRVIAADEETVLDKFPDAGDDVDAARSLLQQVVPRSGHQAMRPNGVTSSAG